MTKHSLVTGLLVLISACTSTRNTTGELNEPSLSADTQTFLKESRESEFCTFGSDALAPYLVNPETGLAIKDMPGLLQTLEAKISSPRVKLDRTKLQELLTSLPDEVTDAAWTQIAAAISCNVFGKFTGFRALATHDYRKTSTANTTKARSLLKQYLDSRASGPEVLFLPILLRLTILEEALKNRSLSLSKSQVLGEVATLRLALKETSGLAMKYHKLLRLNDPEIATSSLRFEFQSAQQFENQYSGLINKAW